MVSKKQKIVVLGLIRNSNGKILTIQRFDPDVKEAHLKWDIPGGTNEFGESLEETLAREIFEETGIKVLIEELLPRSVSKFWQHKDYLQHTLVFCYYCQYLKGKIRSKDSKAINVKWMDLSDIIKLDLLPTTREFIGMLQ